MQSALLVVLLSMFTAFITTGLIFFRKGTHTIGWYFTLMPFVVMASLLTAFYAELLSPLIPLDGPLYRIATGISAVLGAASLLIFGSALGAHRERIPMWHQQEDKPDRIVEWGIYRYVRHPFYTAYCIYMIACALAAPTNAVLATATHCLIALNATAVREEKELLGIFGKQYAAFMLKTGRFFPRLRRLTAAE